MPEGIFVISLDFELHWGVSNHYSPLQYHENLVNTPKGINGMLALFSANDIHCTWATVGMLFCKSRDELFSYVPEDERPRFKDPKLSNYVHAAHAGKDEKADPFHFALSIIKQISNYPHQEISTHTFSHYYCLEEFNNPQAFEADIKAAVLVGKKNNFDIKSIVFPRNQLSERDLKTCEENGIVCYRGTQKTWFHKPVVQKSERKVAKRILRLLDHYVNLTGYNGYDLRSLEQPYRIKNIPQSRFLRPYSSGLSFLEAIRIRRIKGEMTNAAKNGKMYHLWWHPHNFGSDVEKNLSILTNLIGHYNLLKKKYNMQSMNMLEAYNHFFV